MLILTILQLTTSDGQHVHEDSFVSTIVDHYPQLQFPRGSTVHQSSLTHGFVLFVRNNGVSTWALFGFITNPRVPEGKNTLASLVIVVHILVAAQC